jgi:hypothetical protein
MNRVTKTRRLRWKWHLARRGEDKCKKKKDLARKRDSCQNLDVDG